MCTNYAAARRDYLFRHYGVLPPDDPWRDEIFKDYAAPVIRRVSPTHDVPDAPDAREVLLATFGMVPRKQIPPGVKVFEPSYETGKAVRWRIGLADGAPFAIAGLWREWDEGEAGKAYSFTMLTVNASDHPLMKRFHKPGDEKRSVVIVPPSEYENWLASRSMDEARSFLNLYPVEGMAAEPQPLPPRVSPKSDSNGQ